LFTFDYEADRSLAFDRRPWTIRGAHLVLKVWFPDLALSEIDFSRSAFWSQIHGLPLARYNKENVKLIGSKAGVVMDVDFSEVPYGMWQRFARARVNVDITAPLYPRIFISRVNTSDIWIGLK
jgi:hypothetical protein